MIRINTEREHIFSPDIHVAVSSTVNTVISNAQVSDAVKAVCRRHPLLSGTIFIDEKDIAYYRLNSSEPVEINYSENNNALYWHKWIIESNRTAFDLRHGPLLRILVERLSASTTITALGHHLLGDGKSYFYLMRDILMSLDGRLNDEILTPPVIQDSSALPSGAQLGLLPKLLAEKLNHDFRKSRKRFLYSEYTGLHQKYSNEKIPALLTFSLSREETRNVIDSCHHHGVTVNEAISTAFFAARKNSGVTSDYLGVSCDVRDGITPSPKESMGNFVSGISIEADYRNDIGFWENAEIMGKRLRTKLQSTSKKYIALAWADALDDVLLDAVNFVGFGAYKNRTAQKLCDIICGVPADEGLGISNLGRFNCFFNTFALEEISFVPPLFAADDFIVGVITVDHIMRFCIRYAAAKMSEDHAEDIYYKAKSCLLRGQQ
jgi:NRPS condensation-like uncharacterized protein